MPGLKCQGISRAGAPDELWTTATNPRPEGQGTLISQARRISPPSPDLLVPRPRTTWQRSSPAIHTPPQTRSRAPLAGTTPRPPPAGMPQGCPIIARRCPHDISSIIGHPSGGNGLKSAPGDPPRIFQRVESETIPPEELEAGQSPPRLQFPRKFPRKFLGQSAAEPAGLRPESGEAPSALRKNPSIPRNSDGNPDSPQVVVFLATIVDVTVGS